MRSTELSRQDGTAIDTARCPLCGEPNHCTMAADPQNKLTVLVRIGEL